MAEAVDDVSKLAEKADVAEPISRSDKPILDLSPAEGLELLCDNDLWPRVLGWFQATSGTASIGSTNVCRG